MGNQVSLLDENQNLIKALNPLPVTEASAAAILAALVEKASEVTAEAILAKLNAGISVALTGSSVSIEERLWLSTDPDPVPVSNRALGVVIDVATNEMTTKYWDGTSWEEVR